MQNPEVTMDLLISQRKNTKLREVAIISIAIPHTIFWWLLDSYSDNLYIFMMGSVVMASMIGYSEYRFPSKPKMLRAIVCGSYSTAFIILLPKFSFLAICLNFICVWTGVSILTKPQEVYYLILSNIFGWTSCYFYYQYWVSFTGYDDDNTKYARSFIDDSLSFYQLLLAIVISMFMSKVAHIEKDNQIKARIIYEEKLLTLNKNLENTNQQLYKTNQELQEALQEKENFILRFSHEIRNPLNSLLGNVDLSQDYAENKQLRLMLGEAKVSGEILLQLLNNILDTAKVSANRLDISMHYQDIRSFLERAWVVCSEIIRKKKLYGSLSLNVNVPKKIEFDSHRLMQILINMVSNASKFTDHGYVKVFIDFEEGVDIRAGDMKPRHIDSYKKVEEGETIEDELNHFELTEYPEYKYESLSPIKKQFTEGQEVFDRKFYIDGEATQSKRRPDLMSKDSSPLKPTSNQPNDITEGPKEGYLRLEIVDTGCGIKKKDLDTLFTKFSQVSEQSSKRQIGTGLGLWITKEIVELMKGKIDIFSVPGHGTALVMMLKCKSCPQLLSMQQQNVSDELTVARESPSIKRAMIVEDIPYNQEINVKFLQKCGVEQISVANNGKEALNLYLTKGEEYFDFILMDIDMPVMDGKTATKKIRLHETENRWRSTPIVFLTAYSESKMQGELLDPEGVYKADGFLSKPTSQEMIRRTLTEQAIELQERSRKRRSGLSQQNHRKQSNDFSFSINNSRLVLLIDDDPYNLSIVSRMLVKCGFKPLEALNAKQALELYGKHWKDINLVLTDCEMPIMGGIEVTQEILKRDKNSSRIQSLVIYGITGYVDPEYKKKCYSAGMKDVLEKPITLDALRSLLLENRE